jgi:hypothetical protein
LKAFVFGKNGEGRENCVNRRQVVGNCEACPSIAEIFSLECVEIITILRKWMPGKKLFFIQSSFCFVDLNAELPFRAYSVNLSTPVLVFSLLVGIALSLLEFHMSL